MQGSGGRASPRSLRELARLHEHSGKQKARNSCLLVCFPHLLQPRIPWPGSGSDNLPQSCPEAHLPDHSRFCQVENTNLKVAHCLVWKQDVEAAMFED